MASSEIPGWAATNATDGSDSTVWSSTSHNTASNAVEWLAVDYGRMQRLLGASIAPRPGGACFPIDYRIEHTTNLTSWVTVPGMIFTGQAAPRGAVTLNFSNAVFARGLRLYATKLSDDGANHYLQLAEFRALRSEPWATPAELRGKKFIGGGLYTTFGEATAVTPRFLAMHQTFFAAYPFDGIVLPAVLDPEWVRRQRLPRQPQFLHELAWNALEVPYEAIATNVSDLQAVAWGSASDNFLLLGMVDGSRGLHMPDLSNDRDWAMLEHNALMAARLCREAKLKGFWLDTEQYGTYRWRTESGVPEFDPDRPQGLHFPFGKDEPGVLRRRGAQWIKAVQSELPAIKIIITFAWSPDAAEYGPLKGIVPFLDGVLEGIEAPGQLIHGYENTFYYGHSPGTTHTKGGFAGDRPKYESARSAMRQWRTLSANPEKYDRFVKVGMAAWVEDDPWNNPEGWPSGTKHSLWSNLPLALAHTDEYVWVWSEHTKYGQNGHGDVNPYLASLRNETFNTGREPVTALVQDFALDPLQQGWHFDFDMLAIGCLANPAHAAPTMSPEAVPYRWIQARRGVQIRGQWPPRPNGVLLVSAEMQRRRYVRPIQPVTRDSRLRASFDFQVDEFPATADNPIILGLFHSSAPVTSNSLSVWITSASSAAIQLSVKGQSWVSQFPLVQSLKIGDIYHVSFEFDPSGGKVAATLGNPTDNPPPAKAALVARPDIGAPGWDEIGAALLETPAAAPDQHSPFQYLLKRVTISR